MYIMLERRADRHMDYEMNNAHAGVATLHSNLYKTALMYEYILNMYNLEERPKPASYSKENMYI